jgi:uncharacterized membrane protein SpoIIM required for sporulation
MFRFIFFIALVALIAIVLYMLGKGIYNILTKSQASNLEEDIKKGEKAKETIKQLNKQIK